MAPYFIRIAVLLSFILIQTATIAVQAKILVPSSSTSSGRYLQDEQQVSQEEIPKEDGNEFGSAIFENENDNTNSPQFVPHPVGTDVRFQDQDGTWYVHDHYYNTTSGNFTHTKMHFLSLNSSICIFFCSHGLCFFLDDDDNDAAAFYFSHTYYVF